MADSIVNFRLLSRGCTVILVFAIINILGCLFYSMGYSNWLILNKEINPKPGNQTLEILNLLSAEDMQTPATTTLGRTFEKCPDESPHLVTTKINIPKAPLVKEELNRCPDLSPFLVGPSRVEFSTPVSLDTVRKENPHLQVGGRYKPNDCIALQKVAVIIPFRNRDEHLKFWLHYLHPFLQRQQLDYGVYVIDQDGESAFNRAKLMNIGYNEALKEYDYDCFVFSDVDIIPMDDRNTYRCFSQPRHLSVALDKFGFKLPYYQIFGGACSLRKEQMLKVNGFPNTYWGWGGEDDNIYKRVSNSGMSISRPDGVIGKCRMIHHTRDKNNEDNPHRFVKIAHTLMTMEEDGLNSLEYKVVTVQKHILFTKITVDVGEPIQKNTQEDEN